MRLRGWIALLFFAAVACGGPGPTLAPTVPDWEAVEERGTLRVLVPQRLVVDQLPRGGLTLDDELSLLAQFAADHDLTLENVPVASRAQLIPMLLAGEGDLIAANMTASPERREQVRFSLPTAIVREQLVGRAGEFKSVDVRTIHVRRSSSFWATAERLIRQHPGWTLEEVPDQLETEEILQRVADGEYDLTLADSNLVQAVLQYKLPIDVLMDATDDRAIGYAVHPEAEELKERIDSFLQSVQLETRWGRRSTDDLEEIRARRVLRVLTRNDVSSYFVWRGQLRGFDYELASTFARQNGLRLEMVVARPGESLYDLLREGRGDLIAASLIPPPERELDGVRFTRPYNYASDLIVGRSGATPQSFTELEGRTVYAARGSRFWRKLSRLADGLGFELRAAPATMRNEEILRAVAVGTFDLTMTDSLTLAIERSWQEELEGGIPLHEKIPMSWAVRESNPELLQLANSFIRNQYRGLTYNLLYERYFRDQDALRTQVAARVTQGDRLSPYDEIVQRYADTYGFDWRLIVAQMYQESRFHHDAHSFAGAKGLMQVMPQTAAQLGVDDLNDPESAIVAGIRYLSWVYEQYDDILSVGDRTWFALAAYNAGPGHVLDARRLARELGLNPNRWFGHVEHAMLLLAQEEYFSKAKHGYCRCTEPVRYVREIRERFNGYVETVG